MPSSRRGMSTASCVLLVNSQSGTTPSTWRMENHTVSKVSDKGATPFTVVVPVFAAVSKKLWPKLCVTSSTYPTIFHNNKQKNTVNEAMK